MPQLTALRASATTPATYNLTALKVTASGPLPASPLLTALKVTASGLPAVVVVPPVAQTVEPLSTVTLTASLQGGGTADSWTWRQISGITTGIQGTGPTVTLAAPADMNGTTLVIGVRATIGSVTSPEQQVTITVLPQIDWTLSAGGVWQPRPPLTAL